MAEHRLEPELEAAFPRLATDAYEVTSPKNPRYNCVAWAARDILRWWWPIPARPPNFWPKGVPRQRTVESFRRAFESLGYHVCTGEELEEGFERVAIYADLDGVPTHAARQLANGKWSSKIGMHQDIQHDAPGDLEEGTYGKVVLMMRRERRG